MTDNRADAAEWLAQSIRAAIKETERRYGVYIWSCGLEVHSGEDFAALSLAAHVWDEAMRIIEPEPTIGQ